MAASDIVKENYRGVNDGGVVSPIVNAAVAYARAKGALVGPNAASANGYARGYTGADGEILVGRMTPHKYEDGGSEKSATGDTSASPEPSVAFEELKSYMLENKAVSGVSAVGDAGKLVYLTDDDTLTLTRPSTNAQPCGMVWLYRSSGNADVYMFGFDTLVAIMLSGNAKTLVNLGFIDFGTSADGNLLTGIVAPCHGKITGFYGIINPTLVGSGGTIDINLEINGDDVTGGVITMATAALGTKLSGTSITAANVVHEGDLIDVEGSSAGGTRTSGGVTLYAEIEHELGV